MAEMRKGAFTAPCDALRQPPTVGQRGSGAVARCAIRRTSSSLLNARSANGRVAAKVAEDDSDAGDVWLRSAVWTTLKQRPPTTGFRKRNGGKWRLESHSYAWVAFCNRLIRLGVCFRTVGSAWERARPTEGGLFASKLLKTSILGVLQPRN